MTSTQSGGRPVDVDLLADYIEGVLPPDQVRGVEEALASDAAWASTLSELRAAQPRVSAALSAYAAQSGPMPPDLVDRLAEGFQRPAAGVVNLAEARRDRAHRRLHSGWIKAAAIFVLVVLGIGGVLKLATQSTNTSSSSVGNGKSSVDGRLAGRPPEAAFQVNASGINYTALTSPTAGPVPMKTQALHGPSAAAPRSPATLSTESVPETLRPLLPQARLNACVLDIEAATGGTATIVDFASYQHQPALIVTLPDIGLRMAVGPACGAAGVDELARS